MNIQVPNSSVDVGYLDADGNISNPLPKQQDAFELHWGGKYKHILNAGSFGTGKTQWLCVMMLLNAIYFPGNEILTGRKKLSWFESSTLPELLKIIPEQLIVRHDKQRHNIYIRTEGKDSIIRYRQLDKSREALNEIKSMNLGLFAPDQAEEIDEEVFQAAIGRLRRSNATRHSILSCNPAGHNWIWKKWIDGRGGRDYTYIESRMWKKDVSAPHNQDEVTFDFTDNPYLPYDYIANLLSNYPERWLNRYVFCSWDSFEGLVYPDWDDEIHWIKPFPIPDWWNRYIALDHGRTNPTSIGWWATDPKGNVILYDTHYEAGRFVSYHAEMLKLKSKRNGTNLDKVVGWPAAPDIFHRRMEDTIAERYEEYEIYWDLANNDVAGGIDRVASYLKPVKTDDPKFPKGKPKLFVFAIEANEPFREEIKNYRLADISVQDKNMPEKPVKKDDHKMDEARYMINWIEDSVKPDKIEDGWDFLFNKHTRHSYLGV